MIKLPHLVRALHVEDSDNDAMLMAKFAADIKKPTIALHRVRTLAEAKGAVKAGDGYDLVLLDLMLPDSEGMRTFLRMRDYAPDLPIVVVTSIDDHDLSISMVMEGAQDYLVKGGFDSSGLLRAILYAITRHRYVHKIECLTLRDQLTNLYNRTGFMELAGRNLIMANRENRRAFLILADIDGLKLINDEYGHQAGDQVIRGIGGIISSVFRDVDTIGRIDGDKFAVFAMEKYPAHYGHVLDRLNAAVEEYCEGREAVCAVGVSYGLSYSHPEKRTSLSELLTAAENILLEQRAMKVGNG